MGDRMMHEIAIQRIYDDAEQMTGKRILVDRLWPRGVTKERARLDCWMKQIGPSDELRRWYHGGEGDWSEFRRRYIEELRANPGPFTELLEAVAAGPVVLLFAVRDEEQNHAAILRDLLLAHLTDDEGECTGCLW
jgi:uncharacterized protein YeaO (DUF488 family)